MLTLYSLSGSPFGWRCALALQHKTLPHQLINLSYSKGELNSPALLALNPRGRVPVLTDADFALYESGAIVQYLEEAYPSCGAPLFPGDVRARAVIHRTLREIESYLAVDVERLVLQLLRRPREQWSAAELSDAGAGVGRELALFERSLAERKFLCGELSAADHALYPLTALAIRMDERMKAGLELRRAVGPNLSGWMGRIEALPYFQTTYPPHWRQTA